MIIESFLGMLKFYTSATDAAVLDTYLDER